MRLLPPQQKQQKPNMYKDIALYVVYSKTEHIFDTDLESHTCFASSVSFSSYAFCNLILTYFRTRLRGQCHGELHSMELRFQLGTGYCDCL